MIQSTYTMRGKKSFSTQYPSQGIVAVLPNDDEGREAEDGFGTLPSVRLGTENWVG